MRTIVIGAGVIGLATAFELLGRGHDVTVLDPAPGQGASLAAAGMLAPVTETEWAHEALHGLMTEAAACYSPFIARVRAAAPGAIGHRATATLAVGVDAADRETLVRLATLQRRDGATVEQLPGSRARDLEPALGVAVTTAMLVADDHQVDPRLLMAALLRVIGERLRTERVAEVVSQRGHVVGVRLATGETVPANAVVVAAGLGCAEIAGVPTLPIRPVWGDILRLRVPETLCPLLTHTVRALVHGRAVYLVPRDDGTLVVGASVREGGVHGVRAGSVLALLRDAQLVVPGIDECEIIEMLARPRPGSPDAMPMLGSVAPGIVMSTGFDRHGILLAPLAAHLGADAVEGRTARESTALAVAPLRFDRVGDGQPSPHSLTPPAVTALAGAGTKG